MRVNACSPMSSDGECGRKSLPTKNVRSTKSSMRRSRSQARVATPFFQTRAAAPSLLDEAFLSPRWLASDAGAEQQNSSCTYSRRTDRCRSWKSLLRDCLSTVDRALTAALPARLFAPKSMTSRSSVK